MNAQGEECDLSSLPTGRRLRTDVRMTVHHGRKQHPLLTTGQ